jgi:hypothetical protein
MNWSPSTPVTDKEVAAIVAIAKLPAKLQDYARAWWLYSSKQLGGPQPKHVNYTQAQMCRIALAPLV